MSLIARLSSSRWDKTGAMSVFTVLAYLCTHTMAKIRRNAAEEHKRNNSKITTRAYMRLSAHCSTLSLHLHTRARCVSTLPCKHNLFWFVDSVRPAPNLCKHAFCSWIWKKIPSGSELFVMHGKGASMLVQILCANCIKVSSGFCVKATWRQSMTASVVTRCWGFEIFTRLVLVQLQQ